MLSPLDNFWNYCSFTLKGNLEGVALNNFPHYYYHYYEVLLHWKFLPLEFLLFCQSQSMTEWERSMTVETEIRSY